MDSFKLLFQCLFDTYHLTMAASFLFCSILPILMGITFASAFNPCKAIYYLDSTCNAEESLFSEWNEDVAGTCAPTGCVPSFSFAQLPANDTFYASWCKTPNIYCEGHFPSGLNYTMFQNRRDCQHKDQLWSKFTEISDGSIYIMDFTDKDCTVSRNTGSIIQCSAWKFDVCP